MMALLAVAVFAFLVIIWYDDYKYRWNILKEYFPNFTNINVVVVFFVLAIIALCLAFLNALFNFLGGI